MFLYGLVRETGGANSYTEPNAYSKESRKTEVVQFVSALHDCAHISVKHSEREWKLKRSILKMSKQTGRDAIYETVEQVALSTHLPYADLILFHGP
jgi:hypothetical protein